MRFAVVQRVAGYDEGTMRPVVRHDDNTTGWTQADVPERRCVIAPHSLVQQP
jgi:hypothetical protein